jgi:hypothetical protein
MKEMAVALIGLAVTGVTALAIKHPHGFHRMFPAFVAGVAIGAMYAVFVATKGIAGFAALSGIADMYPTETLKSVAALIHESWDNLYTAATIVGCDLAVAAYLVFLLFWPRIIAKPTGDSRPS